MALLLAMLSMVSPFSIDTFFPSFPAIAADFGVGIWDVQLLLTAYLVPFTLLSLVHGPLSDALGRRGMVLAGLAVYGVASVGCLLAPSFTWLLVFRAAQGIAAGVGQTISRAVVRDLYDGPEAQRLMSHISLLFSIAPALAPVIGGWIHVWFGWRAVFGFMVLLAAGLWFAIWRTLPETHPPERRSPFELRSLVRSSWDVARNLDFNLLAVSSALILAPVVVYIGSAPVVVMERWGLGETQFYHLFVPIIGGFMLSSWIGGRMAGRFPRDLQVKLGFAMQAAAALLLWLLQVLWPEQPLWPQQLLLSVMSFGTNMVLPILTIAILDLYPTARGAASSMSSFMVFAGISLAMGVLAPMAQGHLDGIALLALGCGLVALVCWYSVHRRRYAPRY